MPCHFPFLGRVYASVCHSGETTPPQHTLPPPDTVNFTLRPLAAAETQPTRLPPPVGLQERPPPARRAAPVGCVWAVAPPDLFLSRSRRPEPVTRSLGGKTKGCHELVAVAGASPPAAPAVKRQPPRRTPRHGGYRRAGTAPRRSPVPPAGAADSHVGHQRRLGVFFSLTPSHPGDLHRDSSRNTGSKLSSLHPLGDIDIWEGRAPEKVGEEAGGTTAAGASGDVPGEGEARWARCVPARSLTIKDGAGTAVPGTGSGAGGGPIVSYIYLPPGRSVVLDVAPLPLGESPESGTGARD